VRLYVGDLYGNLPLMRYRFQAFCGILVNVLSPIRFHRVGEIAGDNQNKKITAEAVISLVFSPVGSCHIICKQIYEGKQFTGLFSKTVRSLRYPTGISPPTNVANPILLRSDGYSER